jgi:hypothetical protein
MAVSICEVTAAVLLEKETPVATGEENGRAPGSVWKLLPPNYNLPVEAQRDFLLAGGIVVYYYSY